MSVGGRRSCRLPSSRYFTAKFFGFWRNKPEPADPPSSADPCNGLATTGRGSMSGCLFRLLLGCRGHASSLRRHCKAGGPRVMRGADEHRAVFLSAIFRNVDTAAIRGRCAMLWNCGERLDRSATPMRHGPCDIAARFALTPNHVMTGGQSGRDASQNKLGRISRW